MATRASIKFKDSDGKFLANVYHHYDGYPSGLGVKLLELTDYKMVNGMGLTDEKVFNGFGCLVASVIEGLKGGQSGNVYMYSEDDYGNAGEEYLYEVRECRGGCEIFVLTHCDDSNMNSGIHMVERLLVNVLDKDNVNHAK